MTSGGTRTPSSGYQFLKEADIDPCCDWDIHTVDIDRFERKGVVA